MGDKKLKMKELRMKELKNGGGEKEPHLTTGLFNLFINYRLDN